jgi:uncharacterized OsmC-like protein
MPTDTIRKALERAVSFLIDHPDQARYTDSPATARVEEGLRVKVTGRGGESLATDMPTSVGGTGSAPSPGWAFRAALASCEGTLIAMRAAQLGVAVAGVTVTVDSESDDRGILGIDPAVPAGPLAISVRVQIRAPGIAEGEIREVVDWAHMHCPVSDAARRAVPMTLDLTG